MGAARSRRRGLGPARLDGARTRATVAKKVMDSGKRRAPAAAKRWPHAPESAQARIWNPGRRRQPNAVRERSKPKGRDLRSEARCTAREREPAARRPEDTLPPLLEDVYEISYGKMRRFPTPHSDSVHSIRRSTTTILSALGSLAALESTTQAMDGSALPSARTARAADRRKSVAVAQIKI